MPLSELAVLPYASSLARSDSSAPLPSSLRTDRTSSTSSMPSRWLSASRKLPTTRSPRSLPRSCQRMDPRMSSSKFAAFRTTRRSSPSLSTLCNVSRPTVLRTKLDSFYLGSFTRLVFTRHGVLRGYDTTFVSMAQDWILGLDMHKSFGS